MSIIEVSDLPTALQSEEMIADMVAGANAKAARVAPCLVSTDPAPSADQIAEARLILLGAVKRWAQAGSGAVSQQTAGPFSMSMDTRQRAGFNLWPSEIEGLQDICKTGSDGRLAFAVNTAPVSSSHLPWCNLAFGATYCSCGADIAGHPIYELG